MNLDDSAFPASETTYYGDSAQFSDQTFHPGLTKREYFAAIALQGILSNPSITEGEEVQDLSPIGKLRLFAQMAVDAGDSLAERLNICQ